jgi:hypothetical protein
MYTKRLLKRIFLLTLFGTVPFVVSADIVIYTSSSANAGQTGDAVQTYTLRDASLSAGLASDNPGGALDNVQATGMNVFPAGGPTYALLSFDALFSGAEGSKIGGDGSNINSANLFMYQNGNSTGSGTLTIRGLSAGASDWNEGAATWNNKDGTSGGWDGANGDISGALLDGDYGTYSYSDGDANSWISIDITGALQAYAEGTIGGIVLITDGTHNGNRFSFDSSENASGNGAVLRVDQIPEPAVASFMLIGSAYMLVNRRMRRTET